MRVDAGGVGRVDAGIGHPQGGVCRGQAERRCRDREVARIVGRRAAGAGARGVGTPADPQVLSRQA